MRRQVVEKCTKLMRMIGRVDGLGERQLRVALGLAVEGTIGFYGYLREGDGDRAGGVR